MQQHATYHIRVNGQRTTITIDIKLDDLLAIKRVFTPRSAEHRAALRETIQRWIDDDPGKYVSNPSRTIRRQLLELLVDKKIRDRYWDWFLKEIQISLLGVKKEASI